MGQLKADCQEGWVTLQGKRGGGRVRILSAGFSVRLMGSHWRRDTQMIISLCAQMWISDDQLDCGVQGERSELGRAAILEG